MQRLYQWLSERASFFRYQGGGHGASSTVRTETTVHREGATLLVGSAAALGLDICPFCGSKLAPEPREPARHHLSEGSVSQKTGQVDRSPP